MTLFQTFRVAVRAIARNAMRSFLTTLGIVIGVGAVIAMVAIGEGAKKRVEETFASMGTDLLIVMPGSNNQGGARGGAGSMASLTYDDLTAIATEVPSVRAAAPLLRASAQVQSDDQNWGTSIQGTTPAYFEVRSWPAMDGVVLSPSDVESAAKVVVLGATVADKLFGASSAVGQVVRIRGTPFTVVGVTKKKGQSPMGQDFDDVAFIPVSTFRSKIDPGLGNFLTGTMFVAARTPADTARAEKQVGALLRERHKLAEGADDDFTVRNLAEVAASQQESTGVLTTLLASIAAVSLLVGGIGIMNIMLVSVTERTREIGIRMAIGATPGQVLAQFLVEALALSLLGGLIGIALGVGTAELLADKFGWMVVLRTDVIGIAVGFSAFVGVAFGLWPAIKASRLDPIDALRFE